MDAAIGFPPWGAPHNDGIEMPGKLFDPGFRGDPRHYATLAATTAEFAPADYRFYPGVCPGWDNSARRGAQAAIFYGSSPQLYGRWLESAGRQSIGAHGEAGRLVFINAWNEWAESAYLEPDRHFGFAYLVETARALMRLAVNEGSERIDILGQMDSSRETGLPMKFLRRAARKAARILSSV
jgi:hypothetical protein